MNDQPKTYSNKTRPKAPKHRTIIFNRDKIAYEIFLGDRWVHLQSINLIDENVLI